MDSNKFNKITDITRLLNKWKRASTTPNTKGVNLINRFTHFSSSGAVPKGFVAVCVGEELKRYVIPTEFLGHQAFGTLLRLAEEEFGFQQEGVLKIPCQVSVFDNILKSVA